MSYWLLKVIQANLSGVGCAVRTRRHRYHDVLAFLAVEIFDSQKHLVFLQTELRLVSYREQDGMLGVFGANSVDHSLGLKQVFLAEQFLSLLVAGIGADHFAGETL